MKETATFGSDPPTFSFLPLKKSKLYWMLENAVSNEQKVRCTMFVKRKSDKDSNFQQEFDFNILWYTQ